MSQDEEIAQQALSHRQKMMLGLPYDAMEDDDLVAGRLRARKYLKAYNDYPPPSEYKIGESPNQYWGPDERLQNLATLFGISLEQIRNNIFLEPPFYCDYGASIEFKGSCYFNFGGTILDCAKVTIGTRVMCGPSVHIYAATHSTDVQERRAGLERAYPVTIGDDVWIGGQAVIIGPCTIGNGVTVAAGSVVKGDIPDNVVIGGNPARVLKRLDPPPPVASKAQE